jgi:putative component of toxin-antitoxin plasmid stabilization module
MKKVIITSVLFLLGTVMFSAESQLKSIYTSTKSKDCKLPAGIYKKMYPINDEYGYGAEECPGYKKFKIFTVYDDARAWLDISDGVNTWTTMDQVIKGDFGHFPAVREGVAEWRVTKSGEAKALIFRVDAQDTEVIGKVHSRLYVVGFDNGVPKYCGKAKTNEEAVKMADKGNCTVKLNLTEQYR